MKRIIRLTEEQVSRIKSENELTEYRFYNVVRSLLKGLIDKPISYEYPSSLTFNGIDEGKMMSLLLELDIIRKSEKLKDTDDEGNRIKPKLSVSYSVPKNKFDIKLRKLYTTLFDNSEIALEECDGGATSADGAGSFVGPLTTNILKRKIKQNGEI